MKSFAEHRILNELKSLTLPPNIQLLSCYKMSGTNRKRTGRGASGVDSACIVERERAGRGASTVDSGCTTDSACTSSSVNSNLSRQFNDPLRNPLSIDYLYFLSVSVTPYEGIYMNRAFLFDIYFCREYPFVGPKVYCRSWIYHPSVEWDWCGVGMTGNTAGNTTDNTAGTTGNTNANTTDSTHTSNTHTTPYSVVCLNILRENWASSMGISHVIFSLLLILIEIDGVDALNVEAGDMVIEDYDGFVEIARRVSKV